MPRRTTLILEDHVYEKLVKESLRRYGTARAFSKVVNEYLVRALSSEGEVLKLIYSRRMARTSAREFERFRKTLSQRLES